MSKKIEKLFKANLLLGKYLLFALPVVVGMIIWELTLSNWGIGMTGTKGIIIDILGWHFLFWFVTLVYLLFSLAFFPKYREHILTLLTFSKERDERETFISGRASKATFYSTLAILVLFFFLSGLHLNIYKKPKEEAIDGKRGTITIGYSFSFVNKAKDKSENLPSKNDQILNINGIPFTQESIMLFLILYHLASYHIFTRRKFKE